MKVFFTENPSKASFHSQEEMAAAREAEKVKECFQRQIDEVQHDSPLSGFSFVFFFFSLFYSSYTLVRFLFILPSQFRISLHPLPSTICISFPLFLLFPFKSTEKKRKKTKAASGCLKRRRSCLIRPLRSRKSARKLPTAAIPRSSFLQLLLRLFLSLRNYHKVIIVKKTTRKRKRNDFFFNKMKILLTIRLPPNSHLLHALGFSQYCSSFLVLKDEPLAERRANAYSLCFLTHVP